MAGRSLLLKRRPSSTRTGRVASSEDASGGWVNMIWGSIQGNAPERREASPRSARAMTDTEAKLKRPTVTEAHALERILSSIPLADDGEKVDAERVDGFAPGDAVFLWEFRYYLIGDDHALPLLLRAVEWYARRSEIEAEQLLAAWKQNASLSTVDALTLLGPHHAYQHEMVRSFAVDALRSASDSELLLYLLQLVHALRFQTPPSHDTPFDVSGERSSQSARRGPNTSDPPPSIVAGGPNDIYMSHHGDVDTAAELSALPSAACLEGGERPVSSYATTSDPAPEAASGDGSLQYARPRGMPILAWFLIERACVSARIANDFFWFLKVRPFRPFRPGQATR